MYTLLLRLGAPLQSWGSSSYYDKRGTDNMPTKSGVIGLLAAALGRRRDESLDDLNTLNFGVRIDQPGKRLNDFHVTDMGEKLNSNISTRTYLSDALFLVGLCSEDKLLLKELSEAINNPKFPLFLGRRSCPPTQPINLGIRELALQDALQEEPWLAAEPRRAKKQFGYNNEIRLRIITDAESGAIKKDVPVSFSPYKREYRYRCIKEVPAKILKEIPAETFLEHDPMKELG